MGFTHLICSTFGGLIGNIAISGLYTPYVAVMVTAAIISLIFYAFMGVNKYD